MTVLPDLVKLVPADMCCIIAPNEFGSVVHYLRIHVLFGMYEDFFLMVFIFES